MTTDPRQEQLNKLFAEQFRKLEAALKEIGSTCGDRLSKLEKDASKDSEKDIKRIDARIDGTQSDVDRLEKDFGKRLTALEKKK